MRLLSKLHVQLFLAIAAGILFGAVRPAWAVQLKPLGDLFVGLIRVLLAPIIFGTVTVGIGKMSDVKSIGRIGIKAMIYFELVSGLALVIGLSVVSIFRPGAAMNVGPLAAPGAAAAHGALDRLIHPNILLIVLVSICLGIALSRVTGKQAIIHSLDAFLRVMFRIVRLVMYFAPPAAFGAMAYVIGKYGLGKLLPYAKLLACVYGACLLFIVGVLGPIARLSGISLGRFLGYILDEILIVFGTCSTESVLPQMIAKLEAVGCESSLVGMVLPAGYTFNADGTSIYLTIAALFIAQATRTPLTWRDELTVLAVLMVTSKGSAGVAGAGLVTLAATLASTNKIPAAGLSLVLGIESLLNQARAVTNVIGNGVATLAIARWEGKLDREKAYHQLEHPITKGEEGI
ncbi:MAG: cation:dicarboxylase symporter family transporter [Tepidisphaeraceae bacterium]|jgi:Na+/H+-dicarboxylate symporter